MADIRQEQTDGTQVPAGATPCNADVYRALADRSFKIHGVAEANSQLEAFILDFCATSQDLRTILSALNIDPDDANAPNPAGETMNDVLTVLHDLSQRGALAFVDSGQKDVSVPLCDPEAALPQAAAIPGKYAPAAANAPAPLSANDLFTEIDGAHAAAQILPLPDLPGSVVAVETPARTVPAVSSAVRAAQPLAPAPSPAPRVVRQTGSGLHSMLTMAETGLNTARRLAEGHYYSEALPRANNALEIFRQYGSQEQVWAAQQLVEEINAALKPPEPKRAEAPEDSLLSRLSRTLKRVTGVRAAASPPADAQPADGAAEPVVPKVPLTAAAPKPVSVTTTPGAPNPLLLKKGEESYEAASRLLEMAAELATDGKYPAAMENCRKAMENAVTAHRILNNAETQKLNDDVQTRIQEIRRHLG
ncbi:MAG: hypothetical protein HY897_14445 [Deltaproteobacteria bacterium]|nr:hypothetical protein [Deltaproteobacteria bacterium]